MRYTKSDAEPVLKGLARAGITARLIGGIANRGYSDHDIDIAIYLRLDDTEVYDPMDHPEYATYTQTMEKLGFKNVAVDDEEGIEEWHKDQMVIDIMINTIDELPRTERKTTGMKTKVVGKKVGNNKIQLREQLSIIKKQWGQES